MIEDLKRKIGNLLDINEMENPRLGMVSGLDPVSAEDVVETIAKHTADVQIVVACPPTRLVRSLEKFDGFETVVEEIFYFSDDLINWLLMWDKQSGLAIIFGSDALQKSFNFNLDFNKADQNFVDHCKMRLDRPDYYDQATTNAFLNLRQEEG